MCFKCVWIKLVTASVTSRSRGRIPGWIWSTWRRLPPVSSPLQQGWRCGSMHFKSEFNRETSIHVAERVWDTSIFFFFFHQKLKEAQRRDFMFILSSHGTRLSIIDAQLSDALEPFWRSFSFWGWLIIESYRTTTPVQEERFNGNLSPGSTWQRLMMKDEEQLSGNVCS